MTLTLLPDWKRVLRLAWSVRLIALAAVLTGLEAAMWMLGPYLPWRPGWLALAACMVSMAALISRLVAQRNLKRS